MLNHHPQKAYGHCAIAKVGAVLNGKVHSLTNDTECFSVYQQTTSLTDIRPGDQVVYTRFPQGVVVLARLLRNNEPFFQEHQHFPWETINKGEAGIDIHDNGAISIKNPKAAIHITGEGDIHVQGNSYRQSMAKDIELNAKDAINLNSP